MFDPDFELISEAKSPHEISCIVYNEQHNEIVSTGESHIMVGILSYMVMNGHHKSSYSLIVYVHGIPEKLCTWRDIFCNFEGKLTI